jgi:hypothetical protein
MLCQKVTCSRSRSASLRYASAVGGRYQEATRKLLKEGLWGVHLLAQQVCLVAVRLCRCGEERLFVVVLLALLLQVLWIEG